MHRRPRHNGLIILVGTSQVPREIKYVNGEPRLRGYVSTSQEKKKCRNVVFMLVSGIISHIGSGSWLNEEEIKSS